MMWSKYLPCFVQLCVPPSPRSAPRPREVDPREQIATSEAATKAISGFPRLTYVPDKYLVQKSGGNKVCAALQQRCPSGQYLQDCTDEVLKARRHQK